MKVLQPVRQPKAEKAFYALSRIVWGIRDSRLRRRLWHALFRDRTPQATSWRFQLSALVDQSGNMQQMERIAYGIFSPYEVIHWLERAVSSGRLKRSEANQATEYILLRTGRDGGWKILQKC